MRRWLALLCAVGCAETTEPGPADSGSRADARPADSETVADTGAADSGVWPDAAADAGEVGADSGASDSGALPNLDCTRTQLRPLDPSPGARGPWSVGVATATVAGRFPVEVWYPATPGSEGDRPPERYDIRRKLPVSERGLIPEEAAPFQTCDCYRGLPLDTAYGPYPVLIFVHGTAGWAAQSLELVTHWASRGFVVVAADHPGLMLRDILGAACGQGFTMQNLVRDLDQMITALQAPAGELAFLAGHLAPERLGMLGHSAGGGAIQTFGLQASVLVPMASGGVVPGASLRSTLVLGADADQIVAYNRTVMGYEASPAPKRLVGIGNAGHLIFSSLCSLQNSNGEDLLTVGQRYQVCGVNLAGRLFDCSPNYIPDPRGWQITRFATSAVLEETLHCLPERASAFSGIQDEFSEVVEVRQSP